MNDRLPVLRHWTLAIDRYPSKPNGDSLLDPARKGTRAWYESHPEAWELVEVVPMHDHRGAVEALRWAIQWIEQSDEAPVAGDPGEDWAKLEAARAIVRAARETP